MSGTVAPSDVACRMGLKRVSPLICAILGAIEVPSIDALAFAAALSKSTPLTAEKIAAAGGPRSLLFLISSRNVLARGLQTRAPNRQDRRRGRFGDPMKMYEVHRIPSFFPSREARLQGDVLQVTARVPGRIMRVAAAGDQLVADGDLLAEVEHRHLNPRLERSIAEVCAKAAGRVIGVHVQPREVVSLAQPLFSILKHDHLWVSAIFAPADFPRLRAGLRAKVISSGHTCDARVAGLVGPAVRLDLIERHPPSLRPGLPARVLVAPA